MAALTDTDIESRGIDVVRGLTVDAVQMAQSGHAGTPMALAPLAHVLFTRIMSYDVVRRRTGRTGTGSCSRTATRRCSSTPTCT